MQKPIAARKGTEHSRQCLRAHAEQYEADLRKRIGSRKAGVWAVLQVELLTESDFFVEMSPVSALVYARIVQVCVDFLGRHPHPMRFAVLRKRVLNDLRVAEDNLVEIQCLAEATGVPVFSAAELSVLHEGLTTIRSLLETLAQFCPDTS